MLSSWAIITFAHLEGGQTTGCAETSAAPTTDPLGAGLKAGDWAAPLPHLASDSPTVVMPISLMTLRLSWIFISPHPTPSICYSTCCLWLWGGERGVEKNITLRFDNVYTSFLGNVHRPPLYPHRTPPRSSLLASLRLHCYPFAWTPGNRKWHWPLLIPPITFVKRECGTESHIRGRLVIIFAMPSAWINQSGEAASGTPLAAMDGASSDPAWLTALVIKWLYRPLRRL